MENPKANAKSLTLKQETTYRIFSNIIAKQALGTVGAKEIEAFMTIAEQAAIRILEVQG